MRTNDSSRFSRMFFAPLHRWVVGLVLLPLVLFLGACDSGGGGTPPSDLEGTYVFTRFEFTVSGVNDFNLLADTIETSSNSPRMEFFGGNATANLIYRIEGSEGSSLLAGRFSTGGNRITVDFSEARSEDRFQLLLP